MPSGFDIAQICLNGHEVNSSTLEFPAYNSPFCAKCGAATITKCPNCDADIRGYQHGSLAMHYDVPPFCRNCGKPYPWTAAAIESAKELIRMTELPDEDKAQMDKDIEDIVRETPRTTLAATRFKKIMSRAGKEMEAAVERILTNIIVEGANKIIRGG